MKKKNLRMAAGIVLHPFRKLWSNVYRSVEDDLLRTHAEQSWNYKRWAIMHDMSKVTNTGYYTSDLLNEIGCFGDIPKGYES